ncbi:MAG TPA: L,D-transpeptidase family protein [Phycisphaerae bacterium]|nr:L,D-transpeptidase family protein [Phycisphaerae bacterium]
MAGYLRRDRRRRQRRFVAMSIAVTAAVLVVTWPRQETLIDLDRLPLLSGLRSLPSTEDASPPSAAGQETPEPALRPLTSLTPASSQPSDLSGSTTHPAAADAGPTTGSSAASGRPVPQSPPVAGRLADQAVPGVLAKVISPVTQPAGDLNANPHAAARLLQEGLDLWKKNQLLEARDKLNTALHSGLTVAEARIAREALADLADRTIFNGSVVEGDPLAKWHYVTSGDKLNRIARSAQISEDLLARINGMRNKDFLREGRSIKVLQGPFHASICKRDHEMHLYLRHVYVWTARVALGENGKTPTGVWKIANRLENPPWIDPRDGKVYHPDDPANPLGEFWIGMEGIDGLAVGRSGFGIHGTIEPETIGQDVSLGCVRLAPEDIALVYRLLEPGASHVVTHE